MPDRRTLKVGDRIRLLRVPAADLQQREAERRAGAVEAGCAADVIERILPLCPVVTISHIDEYGLPWFDVELAAEDGRIEDHALTIMDDDSWTWA